MKQLSVIPSEERSDESRDPYNAKLLTNTSGPSLKGWLLAAVLAALAILFFVFVARTYAAPPNPTLRTAEWMIVLPFLFALVGVFVQRIWNLSLSLGITTMEIFGNSRAAAGCS